MENFLPTVVSRINTARLNSKCSIGLAVDTLSCPAPAKLNLFLHVVGRRADSYHLLQTLFRFIEFGDTLHFTLREDGVVRRVSALDGVPQEQDLCVRAARLLQQECGCLLGVDIVLEKRIPMGGGLGGGSSDAATTLLALNRLWQLGLSRERLMRIGLDLGADVPVFVFGENAFAEGVGEQLQAYSLPDAWYVVLFPPVHVATAQIFAHPELTRNTISLRIRALPMAQLFQSKFEGETRRRRANDEENVVSVDANLASEVKPAKGGGNYSASSTARSERGSQPSVTDEVELELHNDLQPVVCSLYPEVARHLSWLGQFAEARITGSGACVFAEFVSAGQAQAVLEHLPPDMCGIVARGLPHHPLRDFATL